MTLHMLAEKRWGFSCIHKLHIHTHTLLKKPSDFPVPSQDVTNQTLDIPARQPVDMNGRPMTSGWSRAAGQDRRPASGGTDGPVRQAVSSEGHQSRPSSDGPVRHVGTSRSAVRRRESLGRLARTSIRSRTLFLTIDGICKRLRSPESIPPDWESIPGILKRFTSTDSFYRNKQVVD
jgi:hypothetical protein